MNAIIARIGADAGPLRLGLTEAVKHTQWAHDQMRKAAEQSARAQQKAAGDTAKIQIDAAKQAAAAQKAVQDQLSKLSGNAVRGAQAVRDGIPRPGNRTGGNEGGGHSGGEGGHGGHSQAARLAGEGLDAITGQQGYVTRLQMLSRLGPAGVAVATVAVGILKTVEDLKEMRKANDELGKSLAVTATSESAMTSKREELMKSSKELGEKRDEGYFNKTGIGKATGYLYGAATGKHPKEDSFKRQAEAEKEILRIDSEIADRVKAQISARLESAHGSAVQGALAEAHLKTEEKLAALRDEAAAGKIGLEEYHARRQAAQQEGDLETEAIKRKAAGAERDLGLEAKLLAIKKEGSDAEVKSAAARTGKANADYIDAIKNGTPEEAAAAEQVANAAEQAYRDAKAQSAEIQAQHHLAMQIAALTGSADVKHLASLQLEAQYLAEKLSRAKADDRPAIQEQIAQNQNAQHEAGIAAGHKSFEAANSAIDTQTGVGALEQQKALAKKIVLERSRYAFMAQTDADPAALSAQAAKVAQMQKQFTETAETRERTNKAAGIETAAMQAELAGHREIARALREQLSFQERIAQAKKDGNAPLVKELQTQQKLSAERDATETLGAARARNQPSIGELATLRGSGRAGIEARRYNRLTESAKRAYARHDTKRGDALSKTAEGLRAGLEDRHIIPKDDGAKFKDALDAAKVLQEIKTNTAKYGDSL